MPLRQFVTRVGVALVFALASGRAWDQATASRYAVVFRVDEPKLRALLERHVRVFTEHDDPLLADDRFRYLARTAVQEIEQLLATEGYFSPVVKDSIEPDAGKLTARFEIALGQQTRVAEFNLRLSGAIGLPGEQNRALRERVFTAWPLGRGAVFRSADWEQAKERALRVLHADRFAAARIASSGAEVDPARHSAELRLEIDSGPAFTFGALQVSGLKYFPASVVSAHNPIRAGAPYSEQALADFQSVLQSSGYFSSVFVSIAADPDSAERAPIRVQVVENTRKLLSLGGGYSTDKGFGALARYEGNMLSLPGWRARSTAELHQVEQSLLAEVQLPPFIRNFVPKVGARLKREDLEGQTIVSTVLGASLVRSTQQTELAFSAQIYRDRVEVGELNTDRLKSLPLNASGTLRRLDDLLYPQRGYALNLQVGGAFDEVFSDRRFLRVYGKANAFVPVSDGQTLILRGELGAVRSDSRDGIPDDFLFRAGGSQSVRGYSFGGLGVASGGAVVRGRYLAVGSVEFRQRVAENWWGALFYDRGNVADSASALKAVNGYGLGVRWRSPLGPLNVDLAYGEADRAVRLHFSVGYAF